jgi:hypothetical protein
MSEADRVFPRQDGQEAQPSAKEKRFIHAAPRGGGAGAGKSRVVEVVHVRRSGPRSADDRPRPAPWSVRAETWPEGFRATSAPPLARQDARPSAPEPALPTVHVMAMWEPSPQQPAQPEATPAAPLVGTPVVARGRPRISKPDRPQMAPRPFADPFAPEDSGANCIRCGYLIEPTRERRGLLTCSTCT